MSTFYSARRDSYTGVYEDYDKNSPDIHNARLHFSEWWNGEGVDFSFDNTTNQTISLNLKEIHAFVVCMKACGFIDMDSVEKEAKLMENSLERKINYASF